MSSVDKRPNGKWRARWREYPGGPQKAEHFRLKSEAEHHLVSIDHDLLTGAYVDPTAGRTTIIDYYATWAARQPWRDSTRASVTSIVSRHVLPTFGPRPIGSVRRGDVEAWVAGLDLSASTANLAFQYLASIMAAAVHDRLIAANPTAEAKTPRVEIDPVVPFTTEELDKLRAAAPAWFRVALTLGAGCGLRQGEATGLTEDRIHFLTRELEVNRQLVTPAKGEPDFGRPKTDRSYRRVPMADVALEELAAHLKAHGTGAEGLVLHEDGRPIRRQRFGKVWRTLRTKAGLPDARFHDTRHTFASILLSGGVPVPAAAEYLGDSPTTLLNVYGHLMPADHDRARGAVQAAFTQAAEDSLRTETGT